MKKWPYTSSCYYMLRAILLPIQCVMIYFYVGPSKENRLKVESTCTYQLVTSNDSDHLYLHLFAVDHALCWQVVVSCMESPGFVFIQNASRRVGRLASYFFCKSYIWFHWFCIDWGPNSRVPCLCFPVHFILVAASCGCYL